MSSGGKVRRTVVIGLRCPAYDRTVHVDVCGLDIAFESTGTGPAVVLAHGFVGDARSTWGRQIEAPDNVTRELRRFLRSVESPFV